MIVFDTIPVRIRKIDDATVFAEFEDSGTQKYWDGKIGLNTLWRPKKILLIKEKMNLMI